MKTLTTLAQIVAIVEQSPRPLYVRWSSNARGDVRRGYSFNHQTGQREAGLSVNPLQSDVFSGPAYIAQQIAEYGYLSTGTDARPYLVTGEETGRGSDNEPLIIGVELVAAVAPVVIEEAHALLGGEQARKIREWAAQLGYRLAGRDLHREIARIVGCWPEDVAKVLK